MTKTKTATPAKKSPSLRTLRRKFLAEQKVENAEPLNSNEYNDLYNKMEALEASNLVLIQASQALDELRGELIEAELALAEAETELRAAREQNQTALREVAPLLNRLPTV